MDELINGEHIRDILQKNIDELEEFIQSKPALSSADLVQVRGQIQGLHFARSHVFQEMKKVAKEM